MEMEVELMTFDPDGDLLLRLIYPSESASAESDQAATPDVDDWRSISSHTRSILTSSAMSNASTVIEYCDSFLVPPRVVDMRVSSKHLMLASPVFKAKLLEGRWEARKMEPGDIATLLLPGDDPTIFEILLNIIHGRVRMVPSQVTVDTLEGLAVLVAKYQMLEVVEFYVRAWVPKLKRKLPRTLTPGLIPWLCIAWVFQLPPEFNHVTRIAQLEACGPLVHDDGNSLPIPVHVIDEIEIQRRKGIEKLLSCIKRIIETYDGTKVVCKNNFNDAAEAKRYACDGLILGTLLKSASSAGLWPLPEAPFLGRSIRNTAEQIRSLSIMALCDSTFTKYPRIVPLPAHGWLGWIQERCDAIEKGLQGLNFELHSIQHAISTMQRSLLRQV
ncbi:hypothetical protein QTJ16_005368 [Diplocarpon rosae]|uniref:BTB domain-containing protein n=1 Tax=Diplocarpon rosae TaxID=946125 RepID=A0AAD9SY06_9HELO|nr:hypothetical protein QTJ16_005368 [Diplocarpon rosae]